MTIPVTVLTGFLGAGKTTLLNRLLHGDHGRRLGVIVNEFGEAGIDGELLASGPEEIVELSNGCVCCTVRGDLLRALHGLDARTRLDGVVIEMSGLADPAPVAQTFLWDEALGDRFALDGIVAVADALHVRDQLRDHPEAAEQVAFADLLVLTKTDLADPADLPAVRAALADASPTARVVTADHGALDPTTILGLGGYDLTRLDAHGPHDHHHSHGLGTVTLTARQPLDEEQVMGWLSAYLARHGADILRLKAILDIEGEDRRLSLQGVHMILEGDFFAPWPAGPRQSRLVLIGRGLDRAALQSAFNACIA